MPNHPLLLFPRPQRVGRTKNRSFHTHLRIPDANRQGERLAPKFRQLLDAVESRRIELQSNSDGIEPEQVLVIETVGSIEDFANAAKHIKGLEWMGELEIDEITPDEDFYDGDNPDKMLSGRLYMLMSNYEALMQMLRLWEKYQEDPDFKFPPGLTKFRDIFLHLRDIHKWDVRDRLYETHVIEFWREDLQHDGERPIIFEVELWYRDNEYLRTVSANHVSNLIRESGGRVLQQSIIEGIAYHGILAELPAQAIHEVVNDPSTELVRCENIMFFRPSGQIITGGTLSEGAVERVSIDGGTLPHEKPIIALLDGLPLANHALLAERLVIDDPENWESTYPASNRIHGSAMASLIIHGDLSSRSSPLSRRIYVRPIMRPLSAPSEPRPEGVPEDRLVVDLIHQAVKRLFESEEGGAGVAPQVKVINLSIGDPARQFTHTISPLARLLDWLSLKYNVLFIVSAGNHPDKIDLRITQQEFNSLNDGIDTLLISSLYRDAHNKRILSPGETINGITVGSLHHDSSQSTPLVNRIDPFQDLYPSPVSSFGSGHRRAIKPDLVHGGGRLLYRQCINTFPYVKIEPILTRSAPGNKVASPGNATGELDATVYCSGTSNATALLTREAGICYEFLQRFFEEYGIDNNDSYYQVPLLKALLIHTCTWGDIGERLLNILRTPQNHRHVRNMCSRWLGYGAPDIDRVAECTDQRATILGYGSLSDGEAHVFTLPLPPSLGSRRIWRRMTVTLAWLSPIAIKTQKYRCASLWFDIPDRSFTPDRQEADHHAVRRGTVQHEIFEGSRIESLEDNRHIIIKVNCKSDAAKIINPIAYGLIVSFEIAESINLDIYTEIRERIPTPIIPHG